MISDADRVTHMLDAIAKMRISLGGMSKAEFLAETTRSSLFSGSIHGVCPSEVSL